MIEEEKNALTFEFGNIEDLGIKLRQLIQNPDQRKAMAVYSKDFVGRVFSLQTINNELRRVYESLNADGCDR